MTSIGNPTRIFFTDPAIATYYVDVGSGPVLLQSGHYLTDVSFFNGVLYWTKQDVPKGIAVMTDYGSDSGRTYNVTEESLFGFPRRMLHV